MLVTEGGRFGGYGLYLLKGKPVLLYNLLDLERFRWEGQEALAPGKHTIEIDFPYEGPGFGRGGTGVLKVDDKEVDNKKIPHTIAFLVPLPVVNGCGTSSSESLATHVIVSGDNGGMPICAPSLHITG